MHKFGRVDIFWKFETQLVFSVEKKKMGEKS